MVVDIGCEGDSENWLLFADVINEWLEVMGSVRAQTKKWNTNNGTTPIKINDTKKIPYLMN